MKIRDIKEQVIKRPWLRSTARSLWRMSREIPRQIPVQKISFLQKWSGRPVGIHHTVSDYLQLHPRQGWQKVIHPGGSYERIRPLDTGIILPSRFDPPQTVKWPDERVIFLEQCRCWGGYGGSIITHDEHLLGELSPDVWGMERHALFNKIKLPTARVLPGLTAVISTPEADANYGHWMMDLMPRLELLRSAGYNSSNVDRFLINLNGLPHERESLLRAGIPWDKVVRVDARSHFRCEQIVTASFRGDHYQHSLPEWTSSYLRRLFLPDISPKPGKRRIYVTRKDCSFRRLLNEEELYPLLEQSGFEIVKTERLSVCDQARLFAGAGVVIAVTGAALTNLVFCAPGTRVLEIFSSDFFDTASWTEATIARCKYHALIGDRPASRPPAKTKIEARRQDLAVPSGKFKAALAMLLKDVE